MVHRLKHQGFTIIELMIATVIFSTVLLLCTYALIQIGRLYMKGVTMSRTQEVARSAITEIAQSIQFSGGPVLPDVTTPGTAGVPVVFCVDNNRYTFVSDRQLVDSGPLAPDQANQVLIRDTIAGCNPAASPQPPFNNPRELLANGMRIMDLSVTRASGNESYMISITVVFGDQDLLSADHKSCAANLSAGGGFCAVSSLHTTVQKRVK